MMNSSTVSTCVGKTVPRSNKEVPQDSEIQGSPPIRSETGMLISRLIICQRCGGPPGAFYINYHCCEKSGRSANGPDDEQLQQGRQILLPGTLESRYRAGPITRPPKWNSLSGPITRPPKWNSLSGQKGPTTSTNQGSIHKSLGSNKHMCVHIDLYFSIVLISIVLVIGLKWPDN